MLFPSGFSRLSSPFQLFPLHGQRQMQSDEGWGRGQPGAGDLSIIFT